jgi:hypothetical protein
MHLCIYYPAFSSLAFSTDYFPSGEDNQTMIQDYRRQSNLPYETVSGHCGQGWEAMLDDRCQIKQDIKHRAGFAPSAIKHATKKRDSVF